MGTASSCLTCLLLPLHQGQVGVLGLPVTSSTHPNSGSGPYMPRTAVGTQRGAQQPENRQDVMSEANCGFPRGPGLSLRSGERVRGLGSVPRAGMRWPLPPELGAGAGLCPPPSSSSVVPLFPLPPWLWLPRKRLKAVWFPPPANPLPRPGRERAEGLWGRV